MTSKQLINAAARNGLNAEIMNTLLYAAKKGYPIDYFPQEYQDFFLEENFEVKVASLFDEQKFVEWVKLFPTQLIKGQDGFEDYRVSGNIPECRKRMKTFLNNIRDYLEEGTGMNKEEVWSLIDRATRNYLHNRAKENYQRTKKNFKFIYDNGSGSVLAEWMRKTLNNEINKKSERRSYII